MTEAAYHLIRAPGPAARLIFLCDHAANAVPEAFGMLGLSPDLLATHIAYDIGAADVVRHMAARFGAAAVLARWSRLLIDLNRGNDDPTLVMKLSDGSIIPGNRDAGPEEVARRLADYHAPYHAAVADQIACSRAAGEVPALVSIHSFTPQWKGRARPWEIGVLWDRDGRLAEPLMARLAAAGFVVGNNEPYSGVLENDTLWRHGSCNGLPHALIEIRQDLVASPPASAALAQRLAAILEQALSDMGSAHIHITRP